MKRFFTFLFTFILIFKIFSFSQDDFSTYSFENGLKVYFLEDPSSPTVRLELCVRAGFTCQGRNNGGLFNLYARLLGGELSNDSVRFIVNVAPSATEKALIDLSEKLKSPLVSDLQLDSLVKSMNQEYQEYESSATAFINSAIDSKLFPLSPWERESGLSSAKFAGLCKSREKLRSALNDLSEDYYTAANSILFISGNITQGAMVTLVNRYFASLPLCKVPSEEKEDRIKVQKALEEEKIPQGRKFVLYHNEFSPDMTQIVLQYTSLSPEEGKILSKVWNQDGSAFKKLLLKQRNLKILGNEYIDVSPAVEKSASRLMIQSLMEKSKVSPVVQADLFYTMSRDEDVFVKKEADRKIKDFKTEFTRMCESSDLLMENFSRWVSLYGSHSQIVADFFNNPSLLSKIQIEDLQKKITDESPFVFVFVNSAVYQKYGAEFKKAGFTLINQKESAWYNQKFYKSLFSGDKNQDVKEENNSIFKDIAQSARRFIDKNMSEISSFTLANEIPVTVKRNESSSTAVISMTIAGGELLFTDKVPGLASVLADSIAVNIQRQLDLFAANGAIRGFYEVGARTLSTHSIITISCLAKEIDFAIQAAYTAMVYCDINPALADGVTYDERTQWRLKSGSSEFQLLCEAVRLLYKDTDYPKLYRDTEDKPAENLDFTKILEAYPILLDASRFSLILSGGLKSDDRLKKSLDSSFGLLGSIEETRSKDLSLPPPNFSALELSEKRLSIRHLFLTDISKDKAGPMPAVLVPTTKFLDPLLYCFSSPDLSSTDCALFDALLIEVAARMEEKLQAKYPQIKVKAQLPENDLPFARLLVTSVEHTEEVDSAYRECLSSIKKDISAQIEVKDEGVIDLEKSALLTKFENNWLMAVISEAGSPEGTAKLMQNGLVQKDALLYLKEYQAVNKASYEDYFLLAESYFLEKPGLTIYSKDSKK